MWPLSACVSYINSIIRVLEPRQQGIEMKKQLTMLALLVSAFAGLAHADDSAIQQALKNSVCSRPKFSLHRCQA